MALFQLKWLRRFVRKNTNPIPLKTAEQWKERLSIVYMLLAWNAFGLVCYMCFTGRADWARYYGYKSEADAALSSAQQFAKQFKMDKAKVIQFSGFRRVNEFDIDNTGLKDDDSEKITNNFIESK